METPFLDLEEIRTESTVVAVRLWKSHFSWFLLLDVVGVLEGSRARLESPNGFFFYQHKNPNGFSPLHAAGPPSTPFRTPQNSLFPLRAFYIATMPVYRRQRDTTVPYSGALDIRIDQLETAGEKKNSSYSLV